MTAKLTGRDLRTRALHTAAWPTALNAEAMPGAQLLLEDGDRAFSDGQEWVGDLPAGCEILVPPFAEIKKGWFQVGGVTGLPGGRKLIANKFNVFYVIPNVLSWAIVEPSSLFLDAARTSPVTGSPSPVGGVLDASGADNHWAQPVSGNRPEWISFLVGGETRHRIEFGTAINTELNVPLHGVGQGSCLVFYEGTAIYFPSDFTGLGSVAVKGSLPIQEMLFFDRLLTAGEVFELIAEIQKLRPRAGLNLANWPQAAGFGIAHTNTAQTGWRGWNWITEFPFINTTGTTLFVSMWRDCTRLQAFPLIDTQAGTDFRSAWSGCTALTSFPPLDMVNASLLGSVGGGTHANGAWQGCSGLTSFPQINMPNLTVGAKAWAGCSSLTSFPLINLGKNMPAGSVDMDEAWQDCSGLTSFPGPMFFPTAAWRSVAGAWQDCSGLTSFPNLDSANWTRLGRFSRGAWRNCSGLTSFPLMNFANVTIFRYAWSGCTGLTSFPPINTSAGTDFSYTWSNCDKLVSFPALDFAEGIDFTGAWQDCWLLASFPAVTFPKATNFSLAWSNCRALSDFPAGVFNGCPATNFDNAFLSTALTQTSIDNILVSINSNGTSGGKFLQSGGSAPSATGQAAVTAMRSRGWTVTVTGGF